MSFPTNNIGRPAAMPPAVSDPGAAKALYEAGKNWEQGVMIDLEKAFACYLESAQKGNPTAMYQVALFYNGKYPEVVAPDAHKAEEWYRLSMGGGEGPHLTGEQLFNRFQCHYRGIGGVGQNLREGLRYLQESAERGHPEAMYRLAQFYQRGSIENKEDLPKAAEWFLRGAEAGNVLAMYEIASLYGFGWGVEKNPEGAKHWYQQSCAGNTVEHMRNRGLCLIYGLGMEKQDINGGIEELVRSARRNCTPSALDLIRRREAQAFHPELEKLIRRAAFVEGDGTALILFASSLQNPEEGLAYLKRALDMECREASATLGVHYSEGARQDLKLAFSYLLKAAELGHNGSTLEVANRLIKGEGVAIDSPAALYHYHLAAEKGIPAAVFFLGMHYLDPRGGGDKDLGISYLREIVDNPHMDPELRDQLRGMLADPAFQ